VVVVEWKERRGVEVEGIAEKVVERKEKEKPCDLCGRLESGHESQPD